MVNDHAYVIGNGTSRLGIDLRTLGSGTVIGCNALYRDFAPDYDLPHILVAIDDPITDEINASDFPEDRFFHAEWEDQHEPMAMHRSNVVPRSNAGCFAIQTAIREGYTRLTCLGLDFLVVDQDQAVSNVYDGSNAYGQEQRASNADSRARMGFLGHLIENNPDISFEFLYPDALSVYEPDAKNCRIIRFSDLVKTYK